MTDDPRRYNPRIRCNARSSGGGGNTNLSGRISDLSQTGLFLSTQQVLPIGTQIDLEFDLDGTPIQAVGEVRWVKAGEGVPLDAQGLGIRFIRLPSEAAEAILRRLRRY